MLALLTLFTLLNLVVANPISKRFSAVLIVAGRDGKCLNVASPAGVGTAVTSGSCTGGSLWDINPGSGSVILHGTNLALDAGSSPGNNGLLKVWTSYPGLYQQTWYLTGDNRIAITGGTQCLDEGTNGIQTYTCTTGNTNQIFYVNGGTPPPVSVSSVKPSPTPSSSATPPPASTGRPIYAKGNNLCLGVLYNRADVGQTVAVQNCLPANDPNRYLQLWNFGANGPVQLAGTNYCLDAGSNPSNNVRMKIWTCYNGILQQTWNSGGSKFRLADNQCLDVDQSSAPIVYSGGSSVHDMQTYTCYDGSNNQMFYFD